MSTNDVIKQKKNPVGAPSHYEREMCEKTLKLMKEGYSIAEIAHELDIAKQTLYSYMQKFPEFMDAVQQGIEFSEGWWMKQGRQNLENKNFNQQLYYMNMKNRFKWSDNTKNEVSVTVKQEDALKSLE